MSRAILIEHRGCSSVVERNVANVDVVGSNPITRFGRKSPLTSAPHPTQLCDEDQRPLRHRGGVEHARRLIGQDDRGLCGARSGAGAGDREQGWLI